MKGKKYKRSQNAVQNIYEKYFGIRKPYQIIVDAPFCIETLKIKIAPSAAMTEVFGGAVKLMTTPCIQAELSAYDRKNDTGSSFVARRFEIRRCQHDKGSKTGSECLKDLISSTNPHHYCIASQDIELRHDLRKVVGVPLVFILRDTVLMEAPTDKCLQVVKRLEAQKLKNVDLERIKRATDRVVSSAIKPADGCSNTNELSNNSSELFNSNSKSLKPKKKKKKSAIKNPNPLSCKKGTKSSSASAVKTVQADEKKSIDNCQVSKKKKPRKRQPKKSKKTPKIEQSNEK